MLEAEVCSESGDVLGTEVGEVAGFDVRPGDTNVLELREVNTVRTCNVGIGKGGESNGSPCVVVDHCSVEGSVFKENVLGVDYGAGINPALPED